MTWWFFASTSLGRGRFQHHAGGGANLAHWHEEMPGRTGAVGVLIAVFRLVPGRLCDLDPRPIRLHFVGDDQRHPGSHALPHFGAVANDGDGSVGRNGDESQGVVDRAVRHAVGAPLGGIGGQRPTLRPRADCEHKTGR
jgi:hypothetical protein